MQAILWSLVWILVRWALGVGKEVITQVITVVTEAETLKHEDGSAYTGLEKKNYVLGKLDSYFGSELLGNQTKIAYNALLELALNYIRKATGVT